MKYVIDFFNAIPYNSLEIFPLTKKHYHPFLPLFSFASSNKTITREIH